MLSRSAPSWLEYADSEAKPGNVVGLTDWLTLGFFSVLTMGIMPLILVSTARARRRRLRRFLMEGTPTIATILELVAEKGSFEGTMTKVTYQFAADGEVHRDAELILPSIANRWRVGDQVQALYIAALDYDSVIVSAR